MKKLMIALSAVALAMGVNATVIKGTNLNDSDVSGFTGLGDESQISETPFVASSGENVTDYKSDPAEKNLAIKTKLDAPAYYELDSAASMDGTFFDSMVKFTYCDEDAAVPAGSDAKLMVWVKETEAEGATAGKTNLMITAGYFTTSGLNAKIYDCGPISGYGIAGADDWARLTIKSIPDITAGGDGFPGFNVFVNTKLAKVIADKAIGDEGSRADSLTRIANEMKKGDYLFPSMIQDQDAQLQGVGFAGQGAIDNIAFTTTTLTDKEGLPFTTDPTPAIATVNGQDCGDVAAINNAISTAAEGAAVVLVYNVEDGDLTFGNGKANTLDLGGFTLDGGITVSSGSLAINGTGTVSGNVTSMGEALVINNGTFDGEVGMVAGTINGGLFKKENTEVDALNEFVKKGYELTLNEAETYYQVTEKQLFSGGAGTEADPYIMGKDSDLGQLQELVAGGETYAGKFFKQTADLDLAGEVWEGIGTYVGENSTDNRLFYGVYNGNGKTVSNITFAKKEYNGFFGNLGGAAIVSNLTITVAGFDPNDTTTQSYGFGAAAGYAMGTDVLLENITVNPAVVGQASICGTHNMAGIGARLAGKITLKDCVNNLDISTTYTKIGGMCAIASQRDAVGAIEFNGCVNNGEITGVGLQKADIEAGSDGCAGILGYIQDGSTTEPKAGNKPVSFINCVNNGTLQHTDTTGTTKACIASILGKAGGQVYQTVDGNSAKEDYLSVASGTAPDGLFFATVDDGVATFVKIADLAKDGKTAYKVMAAGAAVTLARSESITLDETLKAATVSPVDAENDEIVQNENTYTCQAIPTATVSITKTNADATISVADGATVKRDTVITVTGVTPAAGYKDAKVTIAGAEQDTYTVKGDEGTIAIVVSATAIPVASITLDITSTNVAPNDVFTLTATVLPADALDKTVTWSVVDDSDVVTITPNGATCEVTAAKAGTATVKAVAGGFEATCSVTVAAPGPIEKDPEEPIDPPAGKSATEYANELNANGGEGAAALVKAPAGVTGEDIATFKGCFKAAVDGDKVKLVLDEEKAATTIVPNLNAADAAIVEGGFGSEVSVTVIPGLYYGITAQADVTDMTADPANWVQATSENKDSFKLAVPEVMVDDVKSDKAFFQVKCSDVDTNK